MREEKRVLLYLSGKLGDTCLIAPVFEAIRNKNKEAIIDMFSLSYKGWLPGLEQLLAYAKFADRFVFASKWKCFLSPFLRIGNLFGFAKYDEIYYLILDSHTLPNKIRKTMPFLRSLLKKNGKILGAKPFACPTGLPENFKLSEKLAWRIRETSDSPFEISDYRMRVSEVLHQEAQTFLRNLDFGRTVRFFCVCVGGTQICKWPTCRFLELLRLIVSQTDLRPVFLGGPGDEEAISSIMDNLPANSAAYAKYCSNDFCKTIALMEMMDFYLGNDTGSIHLAGMAGIPCIGIYSDRNKSSEYHPIGQNNIIIKKEGLKCGFKCNKMTRCPIETTLKDGTLVSHCVEMISVGEVYDVVLKLSSSIAAPKGSSTFLMGHL